MLKPAGSDNDLILFLRPPQPRISHCSPGPKPIGPNHNWKPDQTRIENLERSKRSLIALSLSCGFTEVKLRFEFFAYETFERFGNDLGSKTFCRTELYVKIRQLPVTVNNLS